MEGAEDLRHASSGEHARRIIRPRRCEAWRSGRRRRTRAGGCCHWRRFATGWIAALRPGSAAWTARPCATGSIASTRRVRRASSTIGRRARSRVCRRSNWLSSPRSSRRGSTARVDGVVRWRRIDLKRVIVEKFGVDYHQRYIGQLLKKLGFPHISARPRHPAQDERIVEAFKKTSRARLSAHLDGLPAYHAGRNLVSGRSPHRPEERPRAAMGHARNAASPASRPALRQRLSVRRHLPGARGRRGAGAALRRHRHDATPSRRNLAQRRRGRSRRAAARPRRMAHHRQARGTKPTSPRSSCLPARPN